MSEEDFTWTRQGDDNVWICDKHEIRAVVETNGMYWQLLPGWETFRTMAEAKQAAEREIQKAREAAKDE